MVDPLVLNDCLREVNAAIAKGGRNMTNGPLRAPSIESLIREAEGHLAVYGSLAPRQPNAWVLDGLSGTWAPGSVRGHLSRVGWGGAMGYPGIRWDPDGPVVPVQVFSSPDLPEAWPRIDEFEGTDYRRILIPTIVGNRLFVANIYQVEPP